MFSQVSDVAHGPLVLGFPNFSTDFCFSGPFTCLVNFTSRLVFLSTRVLRGLQILHYLMHSLYNGVWFFVKLRMNSGFVIS